MYAHEAIQTLNKRYLPKVNSQMQGVLTKLIDTIKNSQMFHFGEANELDKMFNKNSTKFTFDAFMNPLDGDLRLPYPICWFDYSTSIFGGTEKEIQEAKKMIEDHDFSISKKKAFLIAEIIPTELLGCVNFALGENDGTQWAFTPIVYYINIGKEFGSEKDMHLSQAISNDDIFRTWFSSYKNEADGVDLFNGFKNVGNVFPVPMTDPELTAKAVPKSTVGADMNSLKLVELSMRLLNCKNIIAETVDRGFKRKVGKKIKKVNSKRKFKYHILNVTKPGQRKKYVNSEDTGRTVRVHLCGGHYKHYIEKGLFGKYFGRFWIQDHVRGNKKKGLLTKDYNIIPNPELPVTV